MLKKRVLAGLLTAFCFLYLGTSSAAQVNLLPDSNSIIVGETLNLDVILTGANPGDVGGFELDILYDTSLFATPVVNFGTSFGSATAVGSIQLTGSAISGDGTNIFESELLSLFDPIELLLLQDPSIHPITGPLPFGEIFLATISLLSIAQGSTDFVLGQIANVSDSLAGSIPLDPGFIGNVVVSPIPLPGAVWLMITGLLGIGAMARTRTK